MKNNDKSIEERLKALSEVRESLEVQECMKKILDIVEVRLPKAIPSLFTGDDEKLYQTMRVHIDPDELSPFSSSQMIAACKQLTNNPTTSIVFKYHSASYRGDDASISVSHTFPVKEN